MKHVDSAQGPRTRRVEVLKVTSIAPHICRFLTGYVGLLTHYGSRGSVYCPGASECPKALHATKTIWKGYAAVEVFDRAKRIWHPFVLEITEALEHQLRGRDLIGEEWSIARQEGHKRNPVFGHFHQRVDLKELRPAFEIMPVLNCLYHCDNLEMGAENPISMPIFLESREASLPDLIAKIGRMPEQESPPTPVQRESLRDAFAKIERAEGGSKNGR